MNGRSVANWQHQILTLVSVIACSVVAGVKTAHRKTMLDRTGAAAFDLVVATKMMHY